MCENTNNICTGNAYSLHVIWIAFAVCVTNSLLFFFINTVPGNLGCFKDSGDPPTLSGKSETSNKLTIQNCISFCRKQKYKVSLKFR